MKIRDLMTTDVVSVRPETTLKEVAELLVGHRISGVPVTDDDGRVLGVVSEGDILLKERGAPERRGGPVGRLLGTALAWEKEKAAARTAVEAMTAPAFTIGVERPATAAARLMVEHGVNRLPVVDRDGKLVGIVSRADLVRAFTRTDEQILAEVREDVLRKALWVDPETVTVAVRDGEVELGGELGGVSDLTILLRLVERVPGVVSVRSTVRLADAEENGIPRAGRFAGYR